MRNNCIYFVEGKCEERLLNALKENPQKIQPGRIKIFNVVQERLPKSQLITIQAGTTVVLVFDTDVSRTDCLKENIKRLSTFCAKIKLVFLPQVLNIEDELVRCCEIKNVIELTHSRSNKDFKRDFCALKNVRAVLEKANLNIKSLWTENTPSEFAFVLKNSHEIKTK
jgi:hypothetical protein